MCASIFALLLTKRAKWTSIYYRDLRPLIAVRRQVARRVAQKVNIVIAKKTTLVAPTTTASRRRVDRTKICR